MSGQFPAKLINEWIAVVIPDKGLRLKNGIILPNDDMKDSGIRPRIAKVEAVSDGAAEKGFEVGQFLLLEHLGWTRPLNIDYIEGDEHKVYFTVPEKVVCALEDIDENNIPVIGSEITK